MKLDKIKSTIEDAENCMCNNKGAHYRKHEMDIPELVKAVEDLETKLKSLINVFNNTVGPWLSASLEDPSVCAEMKEDVGKMFSKLTEVSENIGYTPVFESKPSTIGVDPAVEEWLKNL